MAHAKRGLTALVTTALLGLGLAGPTMAASSGNIDTNAHGSLTIHQFEGAQGAASTGPALGDTTALGTPLAGITFTVEKVLTVNGTGVDLTTDTGWTAAQDATASDITANPSKYTLDTGATATTDETGTASLTDLALGLYYVTETGHGTNPVVSDVAPFLVTLPLPQTGGVWLYDVHVYPKNQLATAPELTVGNPSLLTLTGATPTVALSAAFAVPHLNAGDTYRSVTLATTLPAGLSYQGATIDGLDTADYAAASSGRDVTITFTPAGLGKLTAGQHINAVLTATVDGNALGKLADTATITVNGAALTSNSVSTNWAKLNMTAHPAGTTEVGIAGALFDIYADAALTQKIATVTTDSNGDATSTLFVGNTANLTRTYYVQQTKAPAGYALDPQAHEVTLTADGETSATSLSVANAQSPAVALPLTGSTGYIALGVLLAGLAVGVAIVTVRARKKA